jgi:hypothetical protein
VTSTLLRQPDIVENLGLRQLEATMQRAIDEPECVLTLPLLQQLLCELRVEQDDFSLFCRYNPHKESILLEIRDRKSRTVAEYTEEDVQWKAGQLFGLMAAQQQSIRIESTSAVSLQHNGTKKEISFSGEGSARREEDEEEGEVQRREASKEEEWDCEEGR